MLRVRAVYNEVRRHETTIPPPEGQSLLQLLAAAVPAEAISGIPDLMHHKYVVRDRDTVWTGSTNWTGDAWTRMENVLVVVNSSDRGRRLHDRTSSSCGRSARSSTPARSTTCPQRCRTARAVRALFSPGRGRKMSQLVATRLGQARQRIRICSPVLTSSPILATLAESARRRVGATHS